MNRVDCQNECRSGFMNKSIRLSSWHHTGCVYDDIVNRLPLIAAVIISCLYRKTCKITFHSIFDLHKVVQTCVSHGFHSCITSSCNIDSQ